MTLFLSSLCTICGNQLQFGPLAIEISGHRQSFLLIHLKETFRKNEKEKNTLKSCFVLSKCCGANCVFVFSSLFS